MFSLLTFCLLLFHFLASTLAQATTTTTTADLPTLQPSDSGTEGYEDVSITETASQNTTAIEIAQQATHRKLGTTPQNRLHWSKSKLSGIGDILLFGAVLSGHQLHSVLTHALAEVHKHVLTESLTVKDDGYRFCFDEWCFAISMSPNSPNASYGTVSATLAKYLKLLRDDQPQLSNAPTCCRVAVLYRDGIAMANVGLVPEPVSDRPGTGSSVVAEGKGEVKEGEKVDVKDVSWAGATVTKGVVVGEELVGWVDNTNEGGGGGAAGLRRARRRRWGNDRLGVPEDTEIEVLKKRNPGDLLINEFLHHADSLTWSIAVHAYRADPAGVVIMSTLLALYALSTMMMEIALDNHEIFMAKTNFDMEVAYQRYHLGKVVVRSMFRCRSMRQGEGTLHPFVVLREVLLALWEHLNDAEPGEKMATFEAEVWEVVGVESEENETGRVKIGELVLTAEETDGPVVHDELR